MSITTVRAINLDTYSLSLLTAKEDILNARASTNWALFAYDGVTNNLKLFDSGAGGLTELVQKFHCAKPMYGLCRVGLTDMGQPRIAMICWVGENVDEFRKEECESHVPAVKNFFREAHMFITASNPDDVTEEKVVEMLAKVRPTTERLRRNSRPTEKEETVGTNYRKTNAAMEMKRINRDSFWARAEREEELRKEEERRKAAEERRRLERERIMQERKEADERDRKMNEKLQMIEEQRRAEAKVEEEARRKEKTRWELQQREHEEEMRARLRRSESIEKAAEAAVLVSQRSMNPREFFRQLSSSSQNSTSPMSPRSGKPPFRRYQRSLTDTAFIFERASATSGSTSPLSPSFTSPFSRTPTSPFNRPISPTSPTFRPVTSPPCPRTPLRSPPASPAHRPSPPVASLPSPPASRPPPPQSSPPSLPPVSQASAPPVSPGLQDGLAERELSSPVENRQEPAAVPDAPHAPLPESPVQYMEPVTNITSTRMLSELKPEMDFTVKAVLVEEEEEEEEEEEAEEPCTISLPPSETKAAMRSPDVAEPEQPTAPFSEPEVQVQVSSLVEVEEPTEEEEAEYEQELAEETGEISSGVDQGEAESSGSEEATLEEPLEDEIEADITEDTEEGVKACENGVNGEDKSDQNGVFLQNGTGKEYGDSSEESTPEKCTYIVNREETDEEEDIQIEEAAENGELSVGRRLCVRALYDYQAEDENELSFEPGDIIRDVETVDKAWWRGFSKDGRQGLFPANYVQTM
ncbi:drebrin-like protein A isoform X1 [Astyanax mexicanus]|uniref:drebrin-like protein A isoform X1 n=1 Tax=Astyanax mexicanus TaxID=7994 RepID=UPI0020CAD924|nr:drebrin-like protein A isoform X1 [Astyanax mexicanus]XP_049326325.1 drebrin-like protein A isoform X1 [Astyanax mexicanus]